MGVRRIQRLNEEMKKLLGEAWGGPAKEKSTGLIYQIDYYISNLKDSINDNLFYTQELRTLREIFAVLYTLPNLKFKGRASKFNINLSSGKDLYKTLQLPEKLLMELGEDIIDSNFIDDYNNVTDYNYLIDLLKGCVADFNLDTIQSDIIKQVENYKSETINNHLYNNEYNEEMFNLYGDIIRSKTQRLIKDFMTDMKTAKQVLKDNIKQLENYLPAFS